MAKNYSVESYRLDGDRYMTFDEYPPHRPAERSINLLHQEGFDVQFISTAYHPEHGMILTVVMVYDDGQDDEEGKNK